MNESNKLEFGRLINKLSASYFKEITQEQTDAFWNALKGYHITEIEKGVQDCITTQQFLPTPAVIIDAIGKARRDYKPVVNYSCEYCRGVGFVTVYLRYNAEVHNKLHPGERVIGPTQVAIDKGIFTVISETEFINAPADARVYEFAKRCECRGAIIVSKTPKKGKMGALFCLFCL